MAKLKFFGQNAPKPVTLVEYINKYANRSHRGRDYQRRYWNLARKIKEYGDERDREMMTDSFDYKTFEDFLFFLKQSFSYRNATIKGYVNSLTVIINLARKNNITVEDSFKDFRIPDEPAATVYLTIAEIEKLNAIKLRGNRAIIRDRFLIGCCCGMRYSDYSELELEDIFDNTLITKTKKTGEIVHVPLHWMIQDVMKRNKGVFPPYVDSRQNFNAQIKRICRDAGITKEVMIIRTEGFKTLRKRVKKYRMVSSHTARRSFATNACLEGIPIAKIMLMTGHRTQDAFFRYIRITKEENANDLATHPFFRKKSNFEENL